MASWILAAAEFTKLVKVEDQLNVDLGRLREIYDNGHRHFQALRWLSTLVLLFQVRAYDSQPGKEYLGTFRYDLSGLVTRDTGKGPSR